MAEAIVATLAILGALAVIFGLMAMMFLSEEIGGYISARVERRRAETGER